MQWNRKNDLRKLPISALSIYANRSRFMHIAQIGSTAIFFSLQVSSMYLAPMRQHDPHSQACHFCVASHIRSTSAQLKTPQLVIHSIENLGRTQKLWAFQFPSMSLFICSPSHDDSAQIRSLKFTRALLLAINVVFLFVCFGLKYAKFIHGRREKIGSQFRVICISFRSRTGWMLIFDYFSREIQG